GLRSQRLTGHDHPMLRHHLGAALRGPPFRPHAANGAAKGRLWRGFAGLHLQRGLRVRVVAPEGKDEQQSSCAEDEFLHPPFLPIFWEWRILTLSRGRITS